MDNFYRTCCFLFSSAIMEANPLICLFGVTSPRAQVVRKELPPNKNICFEIHVGILEQVKINHYAGDGIVHLDMHLLFMKELCGLIEFSSLTKREVKKKLFPLYLEENALAWLDNSYSWDWKRLKNVFHSPPSPSMVLPELEDTPSSPYPSPPTLY